MPKTVKSMQRRHDDCCMSPTGAEPHPHPHRQRASWAAVGDSINLGGPKRHAPRRLRRLGRSWARAAAVAYTLLATGAGVRRAAASTGETYVLEDNFREPQDLNGRTIYRSAAASAVCALECEETGASGSTSSRSTTCSVDKKRQVAYTENRRVDFHRAKDSSKSTQWSYADQEHWYQWIDDSAHHPRVLANECQDPTDGTDRLSKHIARADESVSHAYPGGSPIKFDPPSLSETHDAYFTLSPSFNATRSGLKLTNTGKGLTMVVCDQNRLDCAARATFGQWPKVLRGLDSHRRRLADDHTDDHAHDDSHGSTDDEYFLKQVEFHWGTESEWGSEHIVCNNPRSGEVHFVMESIAEIHAPETKLRDAHSGLKTVILSIMFDISDDDSAAYANILDNIKDVATHPGYSTSSGDVVLADLLPEDYASKFYTYAGGLTAPPCSQDVTWYVFENTVPVSEAQLEQLREIRIPSPPSRVHHTIYKAVIFPITAILVGTAAEHWLSRNWKTLPYTVVVLLLGLLYDFFLSLFPDTDVASEGTLLISTLKESTDMWNDIDGHVLLFAFLPALLFGDAMVLNTHHFQRSFWQCLLLACPGVIFGTFSTGLAAYWFLPEDKFTFTRSLPLCLSFGSILAATDPVAVVAILKQLGASPKLTMQITGESLMNDGTALVIFNLFWEIYNFPLENKFFGNMRDNTEGQIDWGNILTYFLQMSGGGACVGLVIGMLAYFWMGSATRKHNESDGIIQLSITVLTAYLSFFIAESEFKMSGVLSCVGAALVLARYAWPVVNSHEALEAVWHALEYFGNTVIFFLTGVIIHRAVVPCVDTSNLSAETNCSTASMEFSGFHFLWMFAFFGVMLVVRCVMIILCYPALRKLGYGTTPKESAFMVWAGLRGAVGISLAILVVQNGGDERAGQEILFMVSGLAFLTLLVSGTTSGSLLRFWGMLGAPKVKKQMIKKVQSRVTANSESEYMRTCLEENHDMIEAIQFLGKLRHRGVEERAQPVGVTSTRKRRQAVVFERMQTENLDGEGKNGESNMDNELLAAVGAHSHSSEHGHKEPFKVEDLEAIAAHVQGKEKPEETAILRETFYNIVKSNYWHMIENGHLPRNSQATLQLLNSIEESLDDCESEVHDWKFLEKIINSKVHGKFQENLDNFANWADDALPDWVLIDNEIHYYLNFKTFEVVYYMCQGFCEAHVEAEHKLANYYGDTHVPDSPEEIKVCLESARKREAAKTILGTVDPRLVEMIKNNIVAENLLELEYNYIVKLINQGVLTEGDAEDMFHQIEQAQRHLALKQKEQGRAFSSEKEEDEDASVNQDNMNEVKRSKSVKRKMSLLNTNPSIAVAQSIMASGAHNILESGTQSVMEKALEKQKRSSDGHDDRFLKSKKVQQPSSGLGEGYHEPHGGKYPVDLAGFTLVPNQTNNLMKSQTSKTKVVPMGTIMGSPNNDAEDHRDLPEGRKSLLSHESTKITPMDEGDSAVEHEMSVRSVQPPSKPMLAPLSGGGDGCRDTPEGSPIRPVLGKTSAWSSAKDLDDATRDLDDVETSEL